MKRKFLIISITFIFIFNSISNSILAQDLNLNETLNYINKKLNDYPCKFSTATDYVWATHSKLHFEVTSDNYLLVTENGFDKLENVTEDKKTYKVKITELDFGLV